MYGTVIQAILFITPSGEGVPYSREDFYRDILFHMLMAEDGEGENFKPTHWDN